MKWLMSAAFNDWDAIKLTTLHKTQWEICIYNECINDIFIYSYG